MALAVGALTGVGAAAGLYGAVFTGIFAAIFGGTATQITGPTLTTMAVVLTTYAAGGWEHLALATLFAGLIQMGLGLFRLGRFITFIPQPVIAGFTNGMAAYIFAKQIPIFAGAPLIGLAAMAIMVIWPKLNRAVPGSLIALGVTAGGAFYLGWTQGAYLAWGPAAIIGEIPRGFPAFHWPALSLSALQPAFTAGLTLALIASIESLLSALIVDDMTNSRHELDRELVGQGVGNMFAAFFRGIIGNGAIVRSVVNTRAGGSTRLSGVIHGVVILAVTLSLGSLAQQVPMATLAGILMMTAIGMIDWESIRDLRKEHPADATVMVVTMVLTYFTPLTFAVGVGVLLSALLFTMRMSQARVMSSEVEPGITVITVDGPLFFGDACLLQEKVDGCSGVTIADLSRMNVVDATGAVMLRKLVQRAPQQGHRIAVCGLNENCRLTLDALGVLEGATVYPSLAAAMGAERSEPHANRRAFPTDLEKEAAG